MSAALADPLIGSIIANRYEVIRRLAKGGMGTIYEVRNTRLGRTFALKTITAEAAQDPEVLARFRREADVVANLSHPHIVEVVDWDQLDDGAPFLVMEYLRGETLAARIAETGGLPWPQIARIGDQVLSALGVAHRAGVVHRDLKPDNIFLAVDDADEERVKLLDFGISKIRDSTTFQSTDAKVLGTPAYMAPEQAEGQHDKIGPATDVWAMGGILYEMVTGSVAFAAPSTPAILYRVCHGRPTPANELRADVPKALVELLDWTLDLELRLDDVEVLREELRKIMSTFEGVTWAEPMRARMHDASRKPLRMSTPISRPEIAIPSTVDPPTEAKQQALAQRNREADAIEHRGRGYRMGGLISVGVGALVLGFGVKQGLDARSISDELSDHQGGWTDAQIARDAEGRSANTKMIVFTSIGAAAVVTGSVLYLIGRGAHRRAERLRISVAPTGAALSLSF